jgi:hypothetical protein
MPLFALLLPLVVQFGHRGASLKRLEKEPPDAAPGGSFFRCAAARYRQW